jgi:hypothetical protein
MENNIKNLIKDLNDYDPKTPNEFRNIVNKLIDKHEVDYYSLMMYAKVNGGI